MVIAGHARRSPSLDTVCNAWLRASGNTEPNSGSTRSSVRVGSCWISAHVSMSRTKKSGSTANRSTRGPM